jgi:hypothetical protein
VTNRLLTEQTWDRITELAKKAKTAMVAVAYFGQGASQLLPLKKGSVLILDMSRAAVKSGQTCPAEVSKLIRRGVEVHTCSNLHAKVFVFGNRAIIGSANASNRSASGLIEAAVETSHASTVAQCRTFIEGLRGEHVDLLYAKKLAKLYKPPQIAGGGTTRTPQHSPLWAVPLVREKWDAEDDRAYEKGEAAAKKKLKDEVRFELESYRWEGGGFRRPLQVGELILEATTEADKRVLLSPVSRVIHIRRYTVKNEQRMIVYLRKPRVRRKALKDVKDRIGEVWGALRKLKSPRVIRDKASLHALLQLWPSLPAVEGL